MIPVRLFVEVDQFGRVTGTVLSQDTQPAPLPSPTPSPVPTPTPAPPPSVPTGMQVMYIGGKNNHVRGQDRQVVIFPIPSNWPDNDGVQGAGPPCMGGSCNFTTDPRLNPIGTKYEVCFSPTPGDFSYPDPLAHFIDGPTFNAGWSRQGPNAYVVYIPADQQWYMNWRAIDVPPGVVAGQTFFVPRG